MHTWTQEIDSISAEFSKAFGSLSSDALNWQPSPERWSIAQNLEHLIIFNESYYPVLKEVRDDKHKLSWLARFSFVPPLMGRLLLQAVAPRSTKKTKTFPIWQPGNRRVAEDIVQRFLHHQEEFKTFIQQQHDLVERGVIITSPANKNIVYPLSSAFDILVAHERRHLGQSKAVMAELPGKLGEERDL